MQPGKKLFIDPVTYNCKQINMGTGISLTVDDLMYILYTCYGITALAATLCIASYFIRSKVLNLSAWLFTILCMVASMPITFSDYGAFSPIIPSFCLLVLLTKMRMGSSGRRLITISVFRSIALLVLFFVSAKLIFDFLKPDIFISPACQILFILYFNTILGVLMYRLLKKLSESDVASRGAFQVIFWSILTGTGTYLTDINYMAVWYRAAHNTKIDIAYALLHLPYPNIFINFAGWACTGIVVYVLWERNKPMTEPGREG
jgi:hypothetical protein